MCINVLCLSVVSVNSISWTDTCTFQVSDTGIWVEFIHRILVSLSLYHFLEFPHTSNSMIATNAVLCSSISESECVCVCAHACTYKGREKKKETMSLYDGSESSWARMKMENLETWTCNLLFFTPFKGVKFFIL